MRLTWMRWVLCGALPVACGDDGIATSDGSTTGGMTTGPSTSTTMPTSEPSTSSPQTDGTTSDDSSTGGGSDSTSLSGGSTEASTGTGSTTDSTGPIVETTSTTEPSTTGTDSSGFLPPPDLGPAAECDLWMQDCPDGEKCEAWANDGGDVWNAWRCSPIAPVAGQAGDPCVVEGSGTSGIDDCDLGLMCFYVDPVGLTGTCVPHCSGSVDDPMCGDPSDVCAVFNSPWLPLCLPSCDPFLQDCAAEQACYAFDGLLACFPDASEGGGGQGEECEYVNSCEAGRHCASVDNLPGCAGATCCTEWCDLDGFMCPDKMDCVPLNVPGAADVGFCGVPT